MKYSLVQKIYFLEPDTICKLTFKGGCKEWKKFKIKTYDDRSYSVKECYEICSKTDDCKMFMIFSETDKCVLYNNECTNDNNPNRHAYYAMDTCSGIDSIEIHLLY